MDNTNRPFNASTLTEKMVTDISLGSVNSDTSSFLMTENTMREAMALQEEIANVFIKNRTDMATSYLVLAAMADSVYAYLLLGDSIADK